MHSISPSIADNSEDFPDPTRPTIATNDPSGMFMSMLKHNQIKNIDTLYTFILYYRAGST
jgi:hypothetical protein